MFQDQLQVEKSAAPVREFQGVGGQCAYGALAIMSPTVPSEKSRRDKER